MRLRKIPASGNAVFLTFDDGPDPLGTPAVLDVLRRHKAKATFFVVAEKLALFPEVVNKILADGHALGNHSWDHRYWHFFRKDVNLRNWIEKGTAELNRFGAESVGFRPPAGVVTPPLLRVLRENQEPLILWNERFFDTVFPLSLKAVKRSASRIEAGSIVLLHDRQKPYRLNRFCNSLNSYLASLNERGLEFKPLNRSICMSSVFS